MTALLEIEGCYLGASCGRQLERGLVFESTFWVLRLGLGSQLLCSIFSFRNSTPAEPNERAQAVKLVLLLVTFLLLILLDLVILAFLCFPRLCQPLLKCL